MILCLAALILAVASGFDRFNYGETETYDSNDESYMDYGPSNWDQFKCPDTDTCPGWPDSFDHAIGWSLNQNHCKNCIDQRCGVHHQSPINLYRSWAIANHSNENECIDVHWMQYHDSTCSFENLQAKDAFVVDRHALRIMQPLTISTTTGKYGLDCRVPGGRRWGRIDFSKGFSQWWFLSHIDFKVPSEHTQEGKRYDAEIQMSHFYSVTGEEAGIDNEMGTVTFFLEAYTGPDWDILNKILCAWRESEQRTRKACGLDSITTEYPGCAPYSGSKSRRETEKSAQSTKSAHDIILHNHVTSRNSTLTKKTIKMDPVEDFRDISDFDWDSFIADQYKELEHGRKLLNYDHVGWHNYFPLLAVRTEYYYRYSGTQTVPPCYGEFIPKNRTQTNHWRVMKDPIRVSNRQIAEMHRLLRERIASPDDPNAKCKPDTAAVVDSDGFVNVARPLQSNHNAHYGVFCECQDWTSKWKEDQDWCNITDQIERYYKRPYNFDSNDTLPVES